MVEAVKYQVAGGVAIGKFDVDKFAGEGSCVPRALAANFEKLLHQLSALFGQDAG